MSKEEVIVALLVICEVVAVAAWYSYKAQHRRLLIIGINAVQYVFCHLSEGQFEDFTIP